MATVSEFNTPSIIITIVLVVVIILAIVFSIRQKKKGKSCCGDCNGCTLCNKDKDFDLSKCVVKPLSRDSYKKAIDLLEIQKKDLIHNKSGQKFIFYKALSQATSAKGIFLNDTLKGFVIFKRKNEKPLKNPFINLYIKLKELSKPFREYSLAINKKENPENGILLIAVNPLNNPDKLRDCLLN